jgi:acyl-CoA hydrolase
MTEWVTPTTLDLSRWIRPGDAIVCGQACGEPLSLMEALIAQRHDLGGVTLFTGSSFSGLLQPEHCDRIRPRSMGSIGSLRSLAKAGKLDIIPCHVGQIGRMIAAGKIGCDVAFIQVTPADAEGQYGLGVIADYVAAAVAKARVVIAEVSEAVPRTVCEAMLSADTIDVAILSDRSPVNVEPSPVGDLDRAIASHVAQFIEDESILQVGIGAVPEAITQLVGDRRDLGVHSGMIGDGFVDLIENGIVTNATHEGWKGVSVTGALIGSERLYRFADRNPALLLASSAITHNEAILSRLPRFVSINSAIEVDLTGQVNAETAGGVYLGGTGGQVDYVRGAMRAPGGHSIIALPATAKASTSRIVASLTGPVTTARSEVDIIVTEYGAAQLRGLSLAERARAMIAIAHPDFREDLAAQAHTLFSRGY